MPLINFDYNDLCSLLGEEVPKEVLIERIPMIGADMHGTEGDSDDMSVEFFPNRPDMYCVEGIARNMRAFLGIEPGMKEYEVEDTDILVTVDPSVKGVRPYILCAAVFDVEIDDQFIKSLMELQEKLHMTIGRKRSKLAIGVHDLDKVVPPFVYRAAEPGEIRFVPLASDEEMDLGGVLTRHEKGKAYAHLLEGKSRYPVITDAGGDVLSFPPIINGALTTVTTETKNLFVDVTGIDGKAVKSALDIVVTAMAERGGSIGSVTMSDGGSESQSPDLSPSSWAISASECARFLGRDISPEDAADALRRMGIDAMAEGDAVYAEVPSTRPDIMHRVDLYEDVAIGYGFESFGGTHSMTQTTGSLMAETAVSESMRDIMLGLGFTEAVTLTLSSEREEFGISGIKEEDLVLIMNPITEDHTCLRASLFPSLMRILRRNKRRDLPQRIFEVGDVISGCRKRRHLCGVVMDSRSSFTESKSYTEAVLREMGTEYQLAHCTDRTFIPGRGAAVMVNGERIGSFGEVSPEVIEGFEITHPVMMVELDLQWFIDARGGGVV